MTWWRSYFSKFPWQRLRLSALYVINVWCLDFRVPNPLSRFCPPGFCSPWVSDFPSPKSVARIFPSGFCLPDFAPYGWVVFWVQNPSPRFCSPKVWFSESKICSPVGSCITEFQVCCPNFAPRILPPVDEWFCRVQNPLSGPLDVQLRCTFGSAFWVHLSPTPASTSKSSSSSSS